MPTVALAQLFFDVSSFFASVVIAMPLAMLALCVWAQKKQYRELRTILPTLHRPMLILWLAGPLACVGSLLLVLANLSQVAELGEIPSPLHPAMLPYTVTVALWLAIFPLLVLFHTGVRKYAESKDTSNLPILLGAGFLAVCFFATKCTIHIPFAGLPEGLPVYNAAVAIMVQAEHAYFYALFPLSVYFLFMLQGRTPSHKGDLFRHLTKASCAVGLMGAIPTTISSIGLLTGYFFRTAPIPVTLHQKALHAGVLFLICTCLAILFFSEKKQRLFFCATCTLTLFDVLLPTIVILFS